MKQMIICLALALWAFPQNAALGGVKTVIPDARRESIEWTDVWIPGGNKSDKSHVLLVGDSITKGYYGGVEKRLKGRAYVARMATSLCLGDPAFIPSLKAVLLQVKFDVIHFNNGLHGIEYTGDEYRTGFEEAARLIRKMQPEAKIIIALSTPLKKGSPKAKLNPLVDERNRIAKNIAESLGAPVDDLNSPMREHPEYYRDPYHYKGPAIGIQAEQVAGMIGKVLETRK